MENRNTILIDFQVEPADGTAERRAALAMADERLPSGRRITLGGDKGYDTRDFYCLFGTVEQLMYRAKLDRWEFLVLANAETMAEKSSGSLRHEAG